MMVLEAGSSTMRARAISDCVAAAGVMSAGSSHSQVLGRRHQHGGFSPGPEQWLCWGHCFLPNQVTWLPAVDQVSLELIVTQE